MIPVTSMPSGCSRGGGGERAGDRSVGAAAVVELAYQWAVLGHPATVDTGGGWGETWDGPAMLGGHGLDESLGGDGTAGGVAGFTPEELSGAALGMSPARGGAG